MDSTTRKDYKQAINVWENRRINGKNMPRAMLIKEIEAFITSRSNCALATGNYDYVRNTPMRYSYKDGKFIFMTEGGYKFKGLQSNPHVSIAIYDTQNLSSKTQGLTVEGEATINELNNPNKAPGSLPAYMITVIPRLMDYLDSSLTERGYYQLQRIKM